MKALVSLIALLCLGAPACAETPLKLATTTSTENSGLLEVLLPRFQSQSNVSVHVIAVGSGKALKLAENGDVDVVLSHAPALEERFVRDGHGVDRRPVMYNDFVIVGPKDDPAKIRSSPGAAEALRRIAASGTEFVSRGDESGTHQKEKALWDAAGLTPSGDWYLSAGLGMGRVLLMASERGAYALTDRGTFLAYNGRSELAIAFEGDPSLHNPYTVMAVNPSQHIHTKSAAARIFIDWLVSPEAQDLIAAYRIGGHALFFPNAQQAAKAIPAVQ